MRYSKLSRAALTAPLYISIAWSLIISYQLLTQTAVSSLGTSLGSLWPPAGGFLLSRLDMISFIHAFAWIFVLSSVIPAIILGKGRSVLLQFFLCLTVTFVAVSVEDLLAMLMGADPLCQMRGLSHWFQNPIVAGTYLSVPYLFMLYLDLRQRRKAQEATLIEFSDPLPMEEKPLSEPSRSKVVPIRAETPTRRTERGIGLNFLHGAAVICFLLAFVLLFLGDVSRSILPVFDELVYAIIFLVTGAALFGLGCHLRSLQRSLPAPPQTATPPAGQPEDTTPEEMATPDTLEVLPFDSVEAPAAEDLQADEPVQLQIVDQPGSSLVPFKYDVRYPRDIVDSQC